MGFDPITLGVDLVLKAHGDRLRVDIKALQKTDITIVNAIGCPAIEFTVVNRGKRTAKIKSLAVCVKGQGFVELFQRGFDKDFGHAPSPDYPEETLKVECLPVDPPNHDHGWVLERDDIARFLFPVSETFAAPIATFNPDNITLRYVTFDGEAHDVFDGDKLQSLVQPLLDYSVENHLRCHVQVKVTVEAVSEALPFSHAPGTVNSSAVVTPLGEPWSNANSDP